MKSILGRAFINAIPVSIIVLWSFLFLFIWFRAYFTPEKALLITINAAGEAQIELILNFVCIFLVIVYILYKKGGNLCEMRFLRWSA